MKDGRMVHEGIAMTDEDVRVEVVFFFFFLGIDICGARMEIAQHTTQRLQGAASDTICLCQLIHLS